MKSFILFCSLVFISINLFSQNIGIGTLSPHTSAQLDVSSTTKGMLVPRMTMAQRMAVTTPATGLLVYQSDIADSSFYWYNGIAWIKIQSEKSGWGLLGNAATNTAANFIGTTDLQSLQFRVNNIKAGTIDPQRRNLVLGRKAGLNMGTTTTTNTNTIIGDSAVHNSTSVIFGNTVVGSGALSQADTNQFNNTIIGVNAGKNSTASWTTLVGMDAGLSNKGYGNVFVGSSSGRLNITGIDNTFVGDNAGRENVTANGNSFFGSFAGQRNNGAQNTFLGSLGGYSNTTGAANLFTGSEAGFYNTAGSNNVFAGRRAGYSNTTGYSNVAIGMSALHSNNTSNNLVAIGDSALYNNMTFMGGGADDATKNTAVGSKAMMGNYTGFFNTALGYNALRTNNYGWSNTAIGSEALYSNFGGRWNTATGQQALYSTTDSYFNTANGSGALYNNTTGGGNTAIGYRALYSNTDQSENTALGDGADVANSTIFNSTVIGSFAVVSSNNTVILGNTAALKLGFARMTTIAGAAFQVGQFTTNGNGAYLTTGGTWTNTSDVNLKENFRVLDGNDLLSKISQLSITQWDYKNTPVKETHIGPMAQQFKQLFGLGLENDDKSISTIDPAGIALAGVQELVKRNEELSNELKKQQQVINDLERRLKLLEKAQGTSDKAQDQ